MDDLLTRFDAWLTDAGPAALVIREHLMPIEGTDGILFPATYAPALDKNKFAGGYNIDVFPDGHNVCLIDSVGSQANRIEPLFLQHEYAGLVPQIVINAGQRVNLLQAGHRAGDAIVRCSALQNELQEAFKSVLRGNADPLAKVAPTSLVFGVWDSRGTQAKLPRLVASTIRAFDVRRVTRSAAYIPPVDHIAVGNIPDYQGEAEKEKYSERGWLQAIPSGTHGGVIATGGVRRDATLSLAALKLLAVRDGTTLLADRTQALRRYILGLALTAFTFTPAGYLRSGCQLVVNPDKPRTFEEVYNDGRREPATVTHEMAKAFAAAAANAFGIDPSRTIDYSNSPDREVEFDKEAAKTDTKGAAEKIQGEVIEVKKDENKFTVQTRKGKQKKDIEVSTTDATSFMKGNDKSAFEEILVKGAKVVIELSSGTATKVMLKTK